MQAPPMKASDWLQITLLASIWGLAFFLTEICLRDFMPASLALGRIGIAALALLALALVLGHRLPSRLSDWIPLLVMGLINNVVPFSLIMWGQTSIDGGLASILNATTPLFTFVLAHFLTSDERMTGRGMAGVTIGFLGALVLIGPGALSGLGAQSWGQLAVLGAAVSYACAGIYGRRLRHLSPIVAAAGMTSAASLIMLPLAMALDQPWTAAPDALNPSLTTWIALLTLGLVSTAGAYILYFRVLASAGATNLLLVTFLIPVAALVLGTSILGEKITVIALLGMLLIFAGLAVIDGRLLAQFSRRKSAAGSESKPVSLKQSD